MLYVYSSFSNTNREEMKALPGSVTLYDREPVLQNWSIARSAVTGFPCFGVRTPSAAATSRSRRSLRAQSRGGLGFQVQEHSFVSRSGL